jgi:hypothetical protein
MLLGPAGAVVGAGVGVAAGAEFLGKPAVRLARGVLTADHENRLLGATKDLAAAAAKAVPQKPEAWEKKSDAIDRAFSRATWNARQVKDSVIARRADDVRYFEGRKRELEEIELASSL